MMIPPDSSGVPTTSAQPGRRAVVTAGPTLEPLDRVRHLTNLSTGRTGADLASFLAARGHHVTLLLSEQAVYRKVNPNVTILPFTTSESLREGLLSLAGERVDALFHVAAVSDFRFGTLWRTQADGDRVPVSGGKLRTSEGALLAELLPTLKLITQMRPWFPHTWLTGWKYEVDGDRASTLEAAGAQLRECHTNACVANGPAYGDGFGLVLADGSHEHVPEASSLFRKLLRMLTAGEASDLDPPESRAGDAQR